MSDDLDNLAEKLVQEAEAMSTETDSEVSKPEASKKSAKPKTEGDKNLQLILDIPLKVTVELGRTKMPVSELLNLTQGSVIELNKLAGEPMEVLVNDKLIARGEAVVVNEKFGVRLTDIISPAERVEQLK
ncbi:MAG: flagellar motor switch protein FliN [Bdellovibrionales bacterium]|nr:flagellar motor switch protein FliN [Bdellovibrionales bacterium]